MNENTEVMAIRIPKDLAAKIREVSKAQNTRLGTALKFIIEQATNDNIETRLSNLEENLKKWINTQVDTNTNLAILNFRVAFLQNVLSFAFPLEKLTQEQRDRLFSGEAMTAAKFVGETFKNQRKHYQDTMQTKHPSYKACLEFFEKVEEIKEGHIT